MNGAALGLLALVPAILGPLPEEQQVISARICGNGDAVQIDIPLPPRKSPLNQPCHAKGCRSTSRKHNLI
ncbi:hypothetical protein K3179_08210 [Qipengyuania sp. GH38]|uniref:hypothetical protein n=1 Tax=Qipengyuania intermedia TaxID=2867244 RepID=UPI001C87DB6A|nr:hypothetical protein [Qipengyuania intermedia]